MSESHNSLQSSRGDFHRLHAGESRNGFEGLFSREHVEQASGVSGRRAAQLGHDRLVAATLCLPGDSSRRAVYQWVEPPNGPDHQLQRADPGVAAAKVDQLVGQDRLDVFRRFIPNDGFRQQHGRAKQADHRRRLSSLSSSSRSSNCRNSASSSSVMPCCSTRCRISGNVRPPKRRSTRSPTASRITVAGRTFGA